MTGAWTLRAHATFWNLDTIDKSRFRAFGDGKKQEKHRK
jgi:hypothetical protein